MRLRYVLILIVIFSHTFGPRGSAQSQQTSTDNERKVVRRVEPNYPQAAKRFNLSGTVKVIAVVAADGNVKQVEPVGGSPLLVQAAGEAISHWKFAPGGESRVAVEVHFAP